MRSLSEGTSRKSVETYSHPVFVEGHAYLRLSDKYVSGCSKLYLGARSRGEDMLINLKTGNRWSTSGDPFGGYRSDQFKDVTDIVFINDLEVA